MSIATFDNDFAMIRDGKVEFDLVSSGTGTQARMVIDNDFQHIFSPKSRVTDAVISQGPQAVAQRYTGGKFFFHGEELVSMKDGFHKGFCHTDDNIASLIEHIGYTDEFDKSIRRTNQAKSIRLQNVQSNVEVEIPGLGSGGEFNSELSFVWDPFQAHINAAFRAIRLICTNGMVGMADFMNTKIPVVNEWTEHMRIANKQIQNKVTTLMEHRIQSMTVERATVNDCQRVVSACRNRLDTPLNTTQGKRLRDIMVVADPYLNLKDHYPQSIFDDANLAKQAASHLNRYTVWNMLTELATHTTGTDANTDGALHQHANRLLIDGADSRTGATNVVDRSKIRTSFDDIDAAFIGDML